VKAAALGVAAFAGSVGLAAILEQLERVRLGGTFVRSLGYHSIPASERESFRRQLRFLASRYTCLDEAGVAAFLKGTCAWDKPGLVISFDDGLLDTYTVAAPLLEEAGLTGWFFVPSNLPGIAVGAQADFCKAGELDIPAGTSGRIAMDWPELRDLRARGHVIGCHTASHRRFRGAVDAVLIESEISGAKALMDRELGCTTSSFAWVGGESDTYAAEVETALRKLGFRFAFTTQSAPFLPGDDPLRIHRTILDPGLNFGLFRLKIAGLSDLGHRSRRAEALQRLQRQETQSNH
jgi:peptidoglycan/xylan/chitin deacetylase (PgdA/CDA1 family)